MGCFFRETGPCESKRAGRTAEQQWQSHTPPPPPALIGGGLQGLSAMRNLQLCCSDSKSVGFETLI